MKKQPTSVNVTKECVAETKPVRGTLDKSGDIRGKEAATFSDGDDAEVRRKSGKVVICYLRLCRGYLVEN